MSNCLHDYKREETHIDAVVDICIRCGKKLITRTNNKEDDKRYLKEHERDFLQPSDPRFKREYGGKK